VDAVDVFLKNASTSSVGSTGTQGGGGRRLFVWTTDDGRLEASEQEIPKHARDQAALVFCHAVEPDQEVTLRQQIQCMTLATAALQQESKTEEDDEKAQSQEQQAASTTTSWLSALQVYTRQTFLPTIQAVLEGNEGMQQQLQDKLRQLDVALAQTSRSTRLPHVVLNVPRILEDAVAANPAAAEKKDWDTLGLADKLQDDAFLNDLTSTVTEWIKQIRTVTILPKSTPFLETEDATAASEEVAFWTQLQTELVSIQEQLRSPTVELAIALLREAKRFVATLALENNTGLEQALAYTQDVTHFLEGFPLQDLQSATDLDQVAKAVGSIFDHMPKVRQSRYYSLERSIQLLQAVTAVLSERLEQILRESSSNLLLMDFKEYENKVRFPVLNVFVEWEDRFVEFKTFCVEQGRRRKQSTGVLSKALDQMTVHSEPLRKRLETLHEFRASHERLREVVHTVLRQEEPAAIQQVEQAPRQLLGGLSLLDLSEKGSKALETALEDYDIQLDAMEERLARLLRDKLQACKVSPLCSCFPLICNSSAYKIFIGYRTQRTCLVFLLALIYY
jgi:dynein heavy chain 1